MSQFSLIEKTLRNRYRIDQLLGCGGFGDTYVAVDLDLPGQPQCVVKHLKPKNPDPAILAIAKERFEKEAQTLYRLGNENNQIPRLFAHFEENGEFYLVQEFVDGHDLTREVTLGLPKNEKVVFKLLKDILDVLAFVHQQNVIHRDIKPQNLMRRKDGKILLIDFGAVKEISAFGQSSGTIAIGTPGYMPSEQQASHPQFSSDIYAVGIIGFQALTGLNPQQLPRDASTGELCCALFSECANINPGFAEILDTMVRYDYRQRYKNAADALEALQQLLKIYQVSIPVPIPTLQLSQTPTTVLNSLTSSSKLPVQPSFLARILQTLRQLFGGSETINPQSPTIIPTPTTTPSLGFEQPEGAVSLDSGFYVERPPNEAECYETIHKPGALIRIKAPRQMGKTSLLTRILHQAKEHGCHTAYLNFRSVDEEFLTSLDKLLCWFCTSITNELNLPDKLTEYWQGILGPKDKCTNYFQRYLLSTINSPIVLGLDDIDQVFQHLKVAGDFLTLLRVWNDKSSNNESWKKLRLVIVHSKRMSEKL